MRRFLPFAAAFLLTATAAALKLTGPLRAAHVDPPPAQAVAPAGQPPTQVISAKDAAAQPLVQVAILLDTSSSMDGLLNQAQARLWSVVNSFNHAHRDGQNPRLEIALYEYGKDTVPAAQGYIRQILPFTTDLDRLSEELFALTTNGGEEYCGQVIQTATRELGWSPRPDALKLIFIAGNEPFTQGNVDFHTSVRQAAEKGIRVNTIYCGDSHNGEAQSWRDGAAVADGRFFAIEQNQVVHDEPAPQDAEISQLGTALNATYVAYGQQGAESQARQAVQDSNSGRWGSMVQRSMAKSSASYSNAGWDLVDAVKNGLGGTIAVKALPPELQGKTEAERQAFLNQKSAERENLKAKIKVLGEERSRFLASRHADAKVGTLDGALLTAIHDEAAAQRFAFE